jgi:hypothetical protein
MRNCLDAVNLINQLYKIHCFVVESVFSPISLIVIINSLCSSNMAPPLPKNPGERDRMWGNAQGHDDPHVFVNPLVTGDAEEPADHLDEATKGLTARFPTMVNLLRSRFGLSRSTDEEWFPVRPLGKGGFGGVAVWERRNSAGEVLEETAVKQAKWEGRLAVKRSPAIAKEAAIMQQLNKKRSDNIVYLKAFKCFRDAMKKGVHWWESRAMRIKVSFH